jgi:hypothetical protein
MLALAVADTTGYEPEELARICAADMLAERDLGAIARGYAAEQRKDENDGKAS